MESALVTVEFNDEEADATYARLCINGVPQPDTVGKFKKLNKQEKDELVQEFLGRLLR